MPIRPPGLSTRAISVSTAGLSVERLITQFEMTTSTESAGSGICSISALEEVDVRDAGLARVLPREREHLVGHVEAVGGAGRADPLGREDHVDAAARAEVEHGLALAQVGDRGRVAAAERREHRRVGQLAALLGVVQRLAELRRVALAVGAAGAAPAAAAVAPLGDRAGRLGVAAPHLLAQFISRRCHQQHTPFRSTTAASFSTASGLQREVGPLAALLALEQPGVDELLQVVRDGRLRQSERLDQVADADRLRAVGEHVHDPHPSRIAERLEHLRRRSRLIVRQDRSRQRPTTRNRLRVLYYDAIASHRHPSMYRRLSMEATAVGWRRLRRVGDVDPSTRPAGFYDDSSAEARMCADRWRPMMGYGV